MSFVSIQNLSKSFGDNIAVKNFSVNINKGDFIGVVGPDGAGKTTLFRLLAGLLTPSSGNINIDGNDTVKDSTKIKDLIGYMPQRFGLYEELSILENLQFYASLKGLHQDEREAKFNELLELTKLKAFTKRLAGRLSGGMKQKLGLACALLSSPPLLLLDEPGVGVDPIARKELFALTDKLLNEGITIFWSTSYLDEAELCRETLLFNEGELLYNGKTSDIIKTIKSKTYLISGLENKRQSLSKLIKDERITDGIIFGSNIRIVTNENLQNIENISLEAIGKCEIKEIKSNFEDAFVSKLNGIKVRHSALADSIEPLAKFDGNIIECQNLTKIFGDFTATKNVDFEIKQGEIFGFLGPNGAGKSTTFKMLCGLLTPTSGTAKVVGIDLSHSTSLARESIGYMAQKFSLYPDLSIEENLDFFAGVYGLSRAQRENAKSEIKEIFNFHKFMNKQTSSLSLGYKQRLALACAVMHRPKILFLDEPTSGVDPLTRREFWIHINAMVQKGVTVMITTHFMDEAEYCDRIALIYKGEKIAMGSPDELKAMVRTENPTLEDAFIQLVQDFDTNLSLEDLGKKYET